MLLKNTAVKKYPHLFFQCCIYRQKPKQQTKQRKQLTKNQKIQQRILKFNLFINQLSKQNIFMMKEEKSKKEKLYYEMDMQLASNHLIRKTIIQGPRSLLRAVSDVLLYNQNRADQLLAECQQYMIQCLQKKTLPKRLQIFYENQMLLSEYKQNPDLIGFNKVHLELISRIYKTKIIMFFLGDEYYLNSTIINNNYSKCIYISKLHNHHDSVYTKEHLDVLNQFQQYIFEKILNNFLFKIDPNTQMNDQIIEPQKAIKRKHKKSLSACDELQFKEFQYILKNSIHNQSKKSVKKAQSIQDDVEQFNLIKQCNAFQRKNSDFDDKKFQTNSGSVKNLNHTPPIYQTFSPNHHTHNVFNMYSNQHQQSPFSYLADMRMIQSERVLSVHSISPTKHQKQSLQQNMNKRCSGRLKFFDQNKNYGFIIMDEDLSDIFVHYDDLSKAGITKDFMRSTKHGNIIRFQFTCMVYVGKYNKSRKAVDLIMLSNNSYIPF